MARPPITLNINVTRIDKSALYEGKSGKYLDLACFLKPDQFGNSGFVVQNIPKERRDAGEKGPIVGSYKLADEPRPEPRRDERAQECDDDGDIPF